MAGHFDPLDPTFPTLKLLRDPTTGAMIRNRHYNPGLVAQLERDGRPAQIRLKDAVRFNLGKNHPRPAGRVPVSLQPHGQHLTGVAAMIGSFQQHTTGHVTIQKNLPDIAVNAVQSFADGMAAYDREKGFMLRHNYEVIIQGLGSVFITFTDIMQSVVRGLQNMAPTIHRHAERHECPLCRALFNKSVVHAYDY